jgi:hypothetical protein
MVGRVWPRHEQRGRPLNSVVRAQMAIADVSVLIAKYRDVARSLWNSAFYPMLEANMPVDERDEWDIRNEFEDICVDLFSSLVLAPSGLNASRLSPAYRGDAVPISRLQVVPHERTEILVAEAEGNSFRGYDRSLTAEEQASLELCFLAFYDPWVLGIRDFEYCHAVVTACPVTPELVGRNVLVRATSVRYELSAP